MFFAYRNIEPYFVELAQQRTPHSISAVRSLTVKKELFYDKELFLFPEEDVEQYVPACSAKQVDHNNQRDESEYFPPTVHLTIFWSDISIADQMSGNYTSE